MAKNLPLDRELLSRTAAAISEGWKVGDLTGDDPLVLAPLVIRRWRSFARRGIAALDRQARIDDLAKYLSGRIRSRSLYRQAALRIAAVLDPEPVPPVK